MSLRANTSIRYITPLILFVLTLLCTQTYAKDDCKTNAECMRRGLPLRAPRNFRRRITGGDGNGSKSNSLVSRQIPLPATFDSIGSAQYYNVSMTGSYLVTASGGGGGQGFVGGSGGVGAVVQAQLNLNKGEVFTVIVGGGGGGYTGGGGGSFVYANNEFIIVAGGGGGPGKYRSFGGTHAGSTSLDGTATSGASGGQGGAGGTIDADSEYSQSGAGGAGILASGGPGSYRANGGSTGTSWAGGGGGGGSPGGYGGGGAGLDGGGGGGGYSGGAGGNVVSDTGRAGGGGGSYVAPGRVTGGTMPTADSAATRTSGQISFTFVA